jgi:hypothetical protein
LIQIRAAVFCAIATVATLTACSEGGNTTCIDAAQRSRDAGVQAALSGDVAKALPLYAKAIDGFGTCAERGSRADGIEARYRKALTLMNQSVALGSAGDPRACEVAKSWVAELRGLAADPAADVSSRLQIAEGMPHAKSIREEAAQSGGAATAQAALCRRAALEPGNARHAQVLRA